MHHSAIPIEPCLSPGYSCRAPGRGSIRNAGFLPAAFALLDNPHAFGVALLGKGEFTSGDSAAAAPVLSVIGSGFWELKLEGVAEVDIDSGRINARAVYTVVGV